jgi:hypothetical protein
MPGNRSIYGLKITINLLLFVGGMQTNESVGGARDSGSARWLQKSYHSYYSLLPSLFLEGSFDFKTPYGKIDRSCRTIFSALFHWQYVRRLVSWVLGHYYAL